jgi:hypothetical protein
MSRTFAVLLVLLLATCGALGRPAARARPAPLTFDAKRAYRDLVRQCDFGPRVPGTESHEKCAAWLVGQLGSVANTVERQVFTASVEGKSLRLTNIVATLNPKGKGHVLLCAHWDSRPTADRDPDPANRAKPISGANDGASGVAVLLEIARALKAHPPEQQITIVLFDGEDYGFGSQDMLLGSRYLAQHFGERAPDWAVLLDMVGDKDLRLPVEPNSERMAPQVVDRVWSAAGRVGAKAFVRDKGPALLDDHIPLLHRGIPCVDVIDFDYPYWHTLADTPDKCSAESLGQVGRAVLAALRGK